VRSSEEPAFELDQFTTIFAMVEAGIVPGDLSRTDANKAGRGSAQQ
jgi:hypothetical protein